MVLLATVDCYFLHGCAKYPGLFVLKTIARKSFSSDLFSICLQLPQTHPSLSATHLEHHSRSCSQCLTDHSSKSSDITATTATPLTMKRGSANASCADISSTSVIVAVSIFFHQNVIDLCQSHFCCGLFLLRSHTDTSRMLCFSFRTTLPKIRVWTFLILQLGVVLRMAIFMTLPCRNYILVAIGKIHCCWVTGHQKKKILQCSRSKVWLWKA